MHIDVSLQQVNRLEYLFPYWITQYHCWEDPLGLSLVPFSACRWFLQKRNSICRGLAPLEVRCGNTSI
jgi:hypothetical protein